MEVRCRQALPHLHVTGDLLGLVRLVRIHLNPSVQAAGEHHPTDLKTASVKSNALHGTLWKHLKLLTQEQ